MNIKDYIKKLIVSMRKRRLNLLELMVYFKNILEALPKDTSRKLFKPHHDDVEKLLQTYEKKNRILRVKSRKQTAKKFIEIVERVNAAIFKCLQELPKESWSKEVFDSWKTEQGKENRGHMFKEIVNNLKGREDFEKLVYSLKVLQDAVVAFLKDGDLQRYIAKTIEQKVVSDEVYDSFKISPPTIQHESEV